MRWTTTSARCRLCRQVLESGTLPLPREVAWGVLGPGVPSGTVHAFVRSSPAHTLLFEWERTGVVLHGLSSMFERLGARAGDSLHLARGTEDGQVTAEVLPRAT